MRIIDTEYELEAFDDEVNLVVGGSSIDVYEPVFREICKRYLEGKMQEEDSDDFQ